MPTRLNTPVSTDESNICGEWFCDGFNTIKKEIMKWIEEESEPVLPTYTHTQFIRGKHHNFVEDIQVTMLDRRRQKLYRELYGVAPIII